MKKYKFKNEYSERLDIAISKHLKQYSRSYINFLIKNSHLAINGNNIVKPSYHAKIGDLINIEIPETSTLNLNPKNSPLDIVFENNDLIVINKPSEITVHPSYGHNDDTLVNILIYHYPDLKKTFSAINNIHRPGIVHRLDKDTTGLIIIAKNQTTLNQLQQDLKNKLWQKKYYALVLNNEHKIKGTINKNIIRNQYNRKQFTSTATEKGKTAITKYKVKKNFTLNGNNLSLMEVELETGRTHQIRVHMLSENMPLIGDQTYCTKQSKEISKKLSVARQLLHAFSLKIKNPSTKKKMTFSAPLPNDFQDIIQLIEKNV